jgi:glycosyltransferase involved in cell wall biosynthesis
LAAYAAGVPRILHTVHGWSFNDFMPGLQRRLLVFLEKFLACFTGTLVCVAKSCCDKGLLLGIGRPGQYRVIRAAVDLEPWRAFRGKTSASRRALGLPASVPVVGTLANCKPQKNPMDFVKVAARVAALIPKAHFVYIGDGPLRQPAQEMAFHLGLARQVHFLGWRKNAAQLAAGFDVFLLTSLWEGLPCVFPQALSLGLPVVATGVDGAAEIIREGENGFLCQPKDVSGLADRVVLLLKNSSLRKKMGRNAAKSVGKEWEIEDMVKKTEEEYG